MSVVPAASTEYLWFGTRAVKFEGGGSTGPQIELLDSAADFATRALVGGGIADFTGSEWQQFLAFSGAQAEMAALGINLANGVDTATAGAVGTTGDLRVGAGVVAHNIADSSGGGRLIDTSGSLDDADDPVAFSGYGKANAARLSGATIDTSETGNRVVFSNDIGFGFINGSGFDSGGTSNATRLNDGDAINVAIQQGRVLSEASFTVKTLGGSTAVVIDSDGATIRDTNGIAAGGFAQDASAGELNLGPLANGTKVTINYENQTIWFNGAVQFLGDTTGFFAAFEAAGSNDLTLGSVVGNQVGWSADDLVLATRAPNLAPVAGGFTGGTGDEDTAIAGQVLASDANLDALAYSVGAGDGPAHGGVVVNGTTGGFTYTPAANYNGADSFTVTISDGQGGSTTQLVNIAVNAVNDAPTAGGFTGGTGNEDTAIFGDVDGADVDGDTLAYSVGAGDGPAHGGVVVNAATGGFTYTPAANYNGADSFTVTISDGQGGSITQLVNIAVNAVNDAPTAGGFTGGTGNEDTAILGDVDGADVDGDTLAYTVGAGDGPAHGGVVVNAATGGFTYTPAANFNGADSFTVTISDGQGGSSSQLVNIAVNAVNDAPTAGGFTGGTGNEDTAIFGDVDGADVDGDTLAYSVGAGDGPAHGGVVVNGTTGGFTYTPAANYNGGDSFTVTISDGNGGTATQLVSIAVAPVADAAILGGMTTGSVREDSPGQSQATGSLTITDPDAGEASFVAQVGATGTYGTFSVTSAGAWIYDINNALAATQALNTGGSQPDSFIVASADGTTINVTVTVNGLNEPVLIATLPSAVTSTGDPSDTVGGGATGSVVFSPPGGGSSNLVTGTTGANLISAGNNNDTVYGYAGADTINGDDGNDSLFGQADGDVINGNDGADTLFGGSGGDSLSGGNGGDLLIGGYGADTLNGGADADTFRYLSANDTNDVLTGYLQGSDVIDFAALNAGTLGFNAAASQAFAAANSVSWYNQGGNTIIIAELDGNVSTAELMLTIQGQTLTMVAGNFIL